MATVYRHFIGIPEAVGATENGVRSSSINVLASERPFSPIGNATEVDSVAPSIREILDNMVEVILVVERESLLPPTH